MKRLLPALLLTALLTACSPSLFDLATSQSVIAMRSMTRDNASLITMSSGFSPDETAFVFYPRVAQNGTEFIFDYSSGFVASAQAYQVNVRGVRAQSGDYQAYGFQSQPLVSPDPYLPSYAAWPAKSVSPSTACLIGFAFNSGNPQQNGYAIFTGMPLAGFLSGSPFPMTNLEPVGPVVGASFSAAPGTNDMTSWLVRGITQYQEMQFSVSSSVASLGTVRSGTFAFLPTGINRFLYFYDLNTAGDIARTPNRSYAQWFDSASGGWKCAAWWGTSGTGDWAMIPVDHRIDALLSTGQLFSTEGGTGRLYRGDGAILATFPLGSLAYIGEQYRGGVAHAYFSQCLVYDRNPHFNVYGIQSDMLRNIGQ